MQKLSTKKSYFFQKNAAEKSGLHPKKIFEKNLKKFQKGVDESGIVV